MLKLSITIFLCMLISIASAAEPRWSWIKTTNQVDKWRVEQGEADVTIKGGKFFAKLYWANNPSVVKAELEGTIKDGKLVVQETILGTDYTGSTYTGSYVTKRWEGFADSAGGESINLSDNWGMIGLCRKISK